MSSPSHSPQPQNHEQNQENDVVPLDSQSQIPTITESPNETRPDPEILPAQDPDGIEEEDEGDELEGQELEQDMHPPITEPHVSISDVTLNPRRATNKRKKGKGKGKLKGKPNIKKQQSIDKKVQSLLEKLNPIPFIPNKILDFAKHEKLLRRLGLWDFVHIDFERSLRVDLIAQLVGSYESRHSYVNGSRIGVNRAELARAFKMPVKKDKVSVTGVQMELDSEVLSEESIGFMLEFVSDWMLLHEDTWIMPNEVMNWLKVIKEGHPEKVDWAGLMWFMIDKELMLGEKLEDCYYASHLQYLMKEQKVFLKEKAAAKTVELNVESKDVEEEDGTKGNVRVDVAIEDQEMENGAVEGPSIELRLGQDGEKEEEGMENAETMNVENCKESDEEGGGDDQGQWLLNGTNNMGEHFLQHCNVENGREFGGLEDGKVEEKDMEFEEGEEETGEEFHVLPNGNAAEEDELTGDFLQAMKTRQISFSSLDQFHDPSSMDISTEMQQMAPSTSFFDQAGKRVIEHDNNLSHHSLNDNNKRLRMNDSLGFKPRDFGMCIDYVQQMTEKARLFYEEKEQALEQANMNQQIFLNEVQKRDNLIEVLHKSKLEEMQKKDGDIYRLERELYVMSNVLDGYKKALKATQKAFDEYRQRFQLHEEPTYKDFGSGGLMLSTGEIERIRKKQEEEYNTNCLIVKQKMKEVEQGYAALFDGHLERTNMLVARFKGLETDAKELIELYVKRKMPQVEEKVPEVAEPQPDESYAKGEVPLVVEKMAEAAEPLPDELYAKPEIPEVEEKVPEVAEPLPDESHAIPQVEEDVPEVAEPRLDE